ncbi:TadE/TadG family type IV pilus assembly protein [Pseudoduganella sp. OTU4001]|uniref:TadE/TadG family type IV pilus assembly protein n=1 Tax=Pseudoduganella sp. OTU4001 TaxID=3043854 RepID=UPI00313E3365
MITKLRRQRGAALVEAGMVLLLAVTFLLALVEFGRLMFLSSAVQEVSRRAARSATVTDFSDSAAMQQLRQDALLAGGAAALPLAPNIGAANIRIDYMWMNASGVLDVLPLPQMPACPMANRLNCARDPQGPTCIRFVRVRLCGSGAGCTPLSIEPLAPWTPLPTTVPTATSLAPAESLGYTPGQAPCP